MLNTTKVSITFIIVKRYQIPNIPTMENVDANE